MHLLSPLLFHTSSHYFLQDHCKEKHPTLDPARCAITYGFIRKYEEYDNIRNYRTLDRQVPEYLREKEEVEEEDEDYVAFHIVKPPPPSYG